MRSLIKSTILGLMMLGLMMPVAQAADSVPPELASPFAQAIAFWGRTPCSEGIRVEVVASLPENEEGNATIGCEGVGVIHILAGISTCRATEVLEHEMGHLLGYGESSDPNSVMYISGDEHRPVCAAEAISNEILSYEAWARREAKRCRHKRHRRSECFATVREIRSEVRRLNELSSPNV